MKWLLRLLLGYMKEKVLAGKKIMWVEDDKYLNDIISRKFAAEECQLVHASDGESALAMVEKEMPDIILLDILLPRMDGYSVLEKLKSMPAVSHIPVLILSNLGQKSDVEKGKALGAEKFIVKATLSLDEIIQETSNILKAKEN